jgi:hypothetical protein
MKKGLYASISTLTFGSLMYLPPELFLDVHGELKGSRLARPDRTDQRHGHGSLASTL